MAYVLSNIKWPKGLVDMPADVRACLPGIRKGAASGKKEAEGMIKCWVRGKPASSACDIHYPRHDQSSREI